MPAVVLGGIGAYLAASSTTLLYAFAFGLRFAMADRAKRKARDAYNASLTDRLVNVPVVDGARSRVYGRARCADGIVYKATHGPKKENYTLVLALAGHQIDAVEQVFFNDVPVSLDGSGYVTTAPWLATAVSSARQTIGAGGTSTVLPADAILDSVGVSTEGSNGDRVAQETIGFTVSGNTVTPNGGWTGVVRHVSYQVANTSSKARVRVFTGAPGQDLSTVLAGLPGITSAHKFQGIACLVIDLVYDQDAFPAGPPSISAVVRGAKVLDPRDGITRWTENPALIARDWALNANGGAAAAAELDAASFIAAANACDVAQSFTTVNAAGATTTQTLPLYTAGLVARTDQPPDEVLGEIVAAMAGRWAWAGGRLRVRAGAYTAPVATLTEDWVSSVGEIDVVSTVPRTELFNTVVPSIANAANAYVVAAIPRIAPSEYITADGAEYPREVSLGAVTDTAHAAHVCGVMLRDSRQALTVSLSCNMRALALELFDVIAVTLPRFGWVAKPFEVLSWGFSQEGGIKLTLKETDASIYNPDATFSRTDAAPNTALPNPYAVPGVSPSSITSGNAQLLRQADGTILSRIRVAWSAVQDEAVRNGGTIEVRYGPADSDPSTYQTEVVAGAETQALLTGVQDGRVYAISTRARNKLVAGAWSIQVLHVVLGKSAPPSNVSTLAATGAPGALRISWAPCPDADYALTELRVGTVWETATRIWRGTGSAYEWATAPGAYTILARHEDTSGNLSNAVVGVSGTALAVVTGGAALNANPACDDLAAWEFDNATSIVQLNTTATGAVGTRYFGCSGPGADQRIWSREAIPLDPAKRYSLTANISAAPGNNRNVYLVVRMFRADGTELDGADTGWGGSYAGYPFGVLPTADSVWRRYGNDFGAGVAGRPIPAAAAYCRVGFWFQHSVGSGAVHQAVQDIRLEDVTAARLASDAAAAAQTTANTASTNATSALTRIAAIDSDGILARGEKAATILDWQALQDEQAGIVARANGFGIVTERDAYTGAYSALAAYLVGLSPGWSDTSQDTTIVPAVYRATWADVYAKRQALLNRIAEVAGQRASWTGVASRPANLAGLSGAEAIRNDDLALGQNLIPGSDQATEELFWRGYTPNGGNWTNAGRSRVGGPALGWTTADFMFVGNTTDSFYARQLGRIGGFTGDSTLINGEYMAADFNVAAVRSTFTELRIPVAAGRRYCLSIYMQSRRCSSRIFLGWLNASGAAIQYNTVDTASEEGLTNALEVLTRRSIVAVAPAGAVTATFFVRKGDTNAGQGDSWVFLAAPQFEEIGPSASGPSPYRPGPPLNTRQLGYTGDLNANQTSVDGSGAIQGVATGAGTTVSNGLIGINASGQFYGGGAGTGTTVSNNQLALSSTGVLSNAGSPQGQVVTLPVRDDLGERSTDRPPSWYPVGTTREFKISASVGLGGADNYLTLETVIQYSDSSGGACYQYAYRGTTTWRRWGVCGASSWAGGWVQDLDRNAYTGDLAATRNDVYRQSSDPGAVPNGSIWLDTSSGKAWQRVAGAWQPYVGTGSVNSAELAAGAAAVVSTSFLAGPVSDANDL